jgi:hypothetical protein
MINCWQWIGGGKHAAHIIHHQHYRWHLDTLYGPAHHHLTKAHRRARKGHWVWTCGPPLAGAPAIGWAWGWPSVWGSGTVSGAGTATGARGWGSAAVTSVPEPSTALILALAVGITVALKWRMDRAVI